MKSITLCLVLLAHIASGQSVKKINPMKVVPLSYDVSNSDTDFLIEISPSDVATIIKGNKRVLVHVWYPWCEGQQAAIKDFAYYQKFSDTFQVKYLFISDNKLIQGTIPALFHMMKISRGFIIPAGYDKEAYIRELKALVDIKKGKHRVFYFENGQILMEGFSYNFFDKQYIPYIRSHGSPNGKFGYNFNSITR